MSDTKSFAGVLFAVLLAVIVFVTQSGVAQAPQGAASNGQRSGSISPREMAEALGTDDENLKASILVGLDYANIHLQGHAGGIRLMPADYQESLFRSLYVFTRAYVESEAFSTDYLSYRQRMTGNDSGAEDSRYPRSGSELVRSRLRFYLEQTVNVEFTASLELKGGTAYFVRDELEEKHPLWKACFRMGPGICRLSRLLAEDWLKDLNGRG